MEFEVTGKGAVSFGGRTADEADRFGTGASAGTRKEATVQEAAFPRLDGRNAWVRALRKHVCAVLIEG